MTRQTKYVVINTDLRNCKLAILDLIKFYESKINDSKKLNLNNEHYCNKVNDLIKLYDNLDYNKLQIVD